MSPEAALLFCEGHLALPEGKTAHGVLRHSRRFNILGVVDSTHAGMDIGDVIEGCSRHVPIFLSVGEALAVTSIIETSSWLIIGLETPSGTLTDEIRAAARDALERGLSVVNPLPDLMTLDPELVSLAVARGLSLLDLRAPPKLHTLHTFTGLIHQVGAPRIPVLGTDSVVGKRTTAWILTDGLNAAKIQAEFIGTGQTAWLQGARYCFVLDAVINNYISGELEHLIHSAWVNHHPRVILIEGQGSVLSPAYPESVILASTRPAAVILQHCLGRREYLDSGGVLMHSIQRHIEAIQSVGGCPVIAVTINPAGVEAPDVTRLRNDIESLTHLPTFDLLRESAKDLVGVLKTFLQLET